MQLLMKTLSDAQLKTNLVTTTKTCAHECSNEEVLYKEAHKHVQHNDSTTGAQAHDDARVLAMP